MGPRIQAAAAFISATHLRPANQQFSPSILPRCPVSAGNEMRSLRLRVHLRAAPVLPEHDALAEKSVEDYDVDEEILAHFDSGNSRNVTVTTETSLLPRNYLQALGKEAPSSAIFLLNMVALLWGTQHAVIKMVVDDSQAAPFTLLRFALAALIASPYTPALSSSREKKVSNASHPLRLSSAWRWGIEMGFWMFLGFSFQAIGLESTTAQRSGFLLYLNVKFVPFFARVFLGRPISVPTWISAFIAFCGTALLASDGQSIGFNEGDAWTVAAAASSAMFIIRLEKASTEVPQSAELNAACLWTVTILAALWTFVQGGLSTENIGSTIQQLYDIALLHPVELIYLGVVTTALANFIQTKAQREISPERASVIYSLDPVYGVFFSWLLLGETLGGAHAFVGAGLITLAAATNAFLDFGTKDESSKRDANL
jgi:drug/metabolite transporter (DMT)-like permease